MGFLDKIKLFFGKEALPEPCLDESVSLNSILDWIDKKSTTISDKLKGEILGSIENIKLEIKSAHDNIVKLRDAQLKNPNISIKEKQFMQGNREAYVKRASIFLEGINIKEDPLEILSALETFDKEIECFGKSTARPYHILQEFFAIESREIAINIRNVDNLIKDIRKMIVQAGFDQIEGIRANAEHLLNMVSKKKSLLVDIANLKKEIDDLVLSRKKHLAELDTIKSSKEFIEHENLCKELSCAESKLKEHANFLLSSFSVIDRALRKFERVAFDNQEIIVKYIADPVAALEGDSSLGILSILSKLKVNLEGDRLDLKDKKKDKTVAEIDSLDKEFFTSFLKKHGELKSNVCDIQKRLLSNKILSEIGALNEQIELIGNQIATKKRNLDFSEQELGKIDISKIKSELVKEIKEALNVELSLS